MNTKDYIQSGAVENYVLGLASDAERAEFERLCAAHPEVAAARDAFERQLEARLLADAVAPPPALREKVLQGISVATAPEVNESATPVRRMQPWKWLAAASFLGLFATAAWGYNTFRRYQDLEARQAATERQLAERTGELTALRRDAETLYKPGMKMVSLKGTPDAPQAYTTVYWDTTGATKDVYLLINNLPQPASDQQYQLWALLDNQPIDLGVFDVEARQKRLLVKMKNVQNAQAFAITLERRGRPNPEKPAGKMYVVGNL